jgi:hypothetical protein
MLVGEKFFAPQLLPDMQRNKIPAYTECSVNLEVGICVFHSIYYNQTIRMGNVCSVREGN